MASGEAALELVSQSQPHVVLLDLHLGRNRLQGLDVLRQLKTQWPNMVVLMWGGAADADTKAEAVVLGAKQFLEKPLDLSVLLQAIQAATDG